MEVRDQRDERLGKVVLTVGSFDGVHRGHRRLLDRLVFAARSRGARSVVVTFDPHPREVLSPGRAPALITTPAERERLLAEAEVDVLQRLLFDARMADTEAREFVSGTLLGLGDVLGFVVGYDFHFGKGRRGNADLLEAVGRERGFFVERVAAEAEEGVAVKSTRIREAVARGDLEAAAGMLGRPHLAAGRVAPGTGRGRSLGFRTANVDIPDPRKLLPPDGVYAVRVAGEDPPGAAFDERGVANLGRRPTFGGGERMLEVHLLDSERGLYGREVVVRFIARLRDERAFDSPEALAAQIARDAARAREILGA